MIPACYSSIRNSLKSKNSSPKTLCDWFVDNKLSIHFVENKMKSILSSSRRNLKLVKELNIRYKEIIKQH